MGTLPEVTVRSSRFLSLLSLAALLACVSPGPGGGGDEDLDGGTEDGGWEDGGLPDGGPSVDADPAARFRWVPVEGTACGSGSTAGFAMDEADGGTDLFLYLQGGGACWNTGTCVPSLVQFGPLCDYGNLCLIGEAGGQKPTSSHVIHPDPFPADGGGVLPQELRNFASSRIVLREDPANPFRHATFVYIPYCTGDLHGGDAIREYRYRYGLFDPERTYRMHFKGAVNVELDLQALAERIPAPARIWLSGASAGGYGATLNLERVKRHFPNAEVHLLADSSPLIDSTRWSEFRDAWNLQLPEGCSDCDAGLPRVMEHVLAHNPDSRIGLMAFDQDRTIAWFFLAAPGLDNFTSPPLGAYTAELDDLLASYDDAPNAAYFVLPTDEHVMWPFYGTRQANGTLTPPRLSPDGGTHLKAWVDAWALGDAGFSSVR